MAVTSPDRKDDYNYCALPLAPYASRPDQTKGRLHAEPESANRTPFQRDRDRIIHASAFRRLQYKTQVFVRYEGDHYRTRLTHTLEVSQIARSLARALMINEDLADAIALAHDLGHTPFAHIGEDFLKVCMGPHGGFEHNDQSLRVVTKLERKYARWEGLNLSWETLEGIVKHNGPVTKHPLPATLGEVQKETDLRLSTFAPLEAQVAAIADDIAYNNHDVEDGLRAGMFTLKDLENLSLLAPIVAGVRGGPAGESDHYVRQETIREMIGAMVEDVLTETRRRLEKIRPQSADDIRGASAPCVAFSDGMLEKVNELRKFLFVRMYKHDSIMRLAPQIEKIITGLFNAYSDDPSRMPEDWARRVGEAPVARVVCDYIAGMTDPYAVGQYERLFEVRLEIR